MNNEKWYVVENIADEVEVAIVKLTDDEVKAVNKFFNTQKVVVDEVFVGRTIFYNKPFNTEEEAIEAVNHSTYYD